LSGRFSLAEKILQELREEILNCAIQAGELLTEMEVSRRYGCSKTPAREALNSLCVEKYLDKLPNRGYLVKAVSLADVQNLFQFRYIQESASAELAAMKATPEQLAILEKMCDGIDDMSSEEVSERYNELNHALHMQLAHMAGNPYLLDAINNVLGQLKRALTMDLHHSSPREALREHVGIVEAIREHNAPRARELMQEHLNRAQSRIFAQHVYIRQTAHRE
jgi:DNA-binding GntR family transcriptional regulator